MARKNKQPTAPVTPEDVVQPTAPEAPSAPPPTTLERLANWLPEHEERITKITAQAEAHAEESFESFVALGEELGSIKAEFANAGGKPKEFNDWATDRFKFSKQWANRVIRLAENVENIRPLLADIPPAKRTVDKALSLFAKAQKGEAGEGEGESEGSAAPNPSKGELKEGMASAVDLLERLMVVAAAGAMARKDENLEHSLEVFDQLTDLSITAGVFLERASALGFGDQGEDEAGDPPAPPSSDDEPPFDVDIPEAAAEEAPEPKALSKGQITRAKRAFATVADGEANKADQDKARDYLTDLAAKTHRSVDDLRTVVLG